MTWVDWTVLSTVTAVFLVGFWVLFLIDKRKRMPGPPVLPNPDDD